MDEWKNVFVFCELDDNRKLKNVAFELTSKARQLADKLSQDVCSVVIGHDIPEDELKKLADYGADRIFVADDPKFSEYDSVLFAEAIVRLINKEKPYIFIYPGTKLGRDLAPRVAGTLQIGLTADCTGLDIREDGLLEQTRPAYGGNIIGVIITPETRPQMASVRPNVFKAVKLSEPAKGEIVKFGDDVPEDIKKTRILKVEMPEDTTVDITEANIIVSAGRGIGDKENLKMIEELANLLGGAVGASRTIVDLGWISKSHQVGQTGHTVAPAFYIAVGISGMIQHIVGMKTSDTIIAINKDPEAPIFQFSDLGVVADALEFVPKLTERLREEIEKSGS